MKPLERAAGGLHDPPCAPYRQHQPPGNQAFPQGHDPPLAVHEDRVDGKPHADGVDRVAARENQRLVLRQPAVGQEPDHALPPRAGDLRLPCHDLTGALNGQAPSPFPQRQFAPRKRSVRGFRGALWNTNR